MELFGVGPAELLLIVVVALVFLGPEELPGVARKAAHVYREVRQIRNELMREVQRGLDISDAAPPPPPAAQPAAPPSGNGASGAPSAVPRTPEPAEQAGQAEDGSLRPPY